MKGGSPSYAFHQSEGFLSQGTNVDHVKPLTYDGNSGHENFSNLYKVSGLANLLNENKKQLLNGIQNYLAKKVVKKKVVKKKLKESDSDEEDVYEFEVDKELNEEFVNANIEAGFSIGGIRHNLLDKINGLELIIESKFGDPKKGDEIRTFLG